MKRNKGILFVIIGAIVGLVAIIVVLGLAWYFISPLFIDRSVDESFPLEIPNEVEMAEMSAEEVEEMRVEMEATAAAMPDTEMDEAMPAGDATGDPVAVRQGEFVDADSFHQGEGTATIYELPDGSFVLRLENFMVTNGPDLHMILATGAAPTGRGDLGEYVDLGSLKGNIGDQNYEIPADVDLNQYQSIVVYCMPFHVVFSVASLNG